MNAASKIPPLRFKGCDGAWEEKRLGEMGSPYNGLSGKCKSDFGHGDGRYVTYLNVFNNPVVETEECDRIEIDKSQNEVCDGDVFFTTSSETPEEVGMASVWKGDGKNTYLNSFCFGYRPKSKTNANFWAYMLRSDSFRDRIVVLAQGISRYNISKGKVMELPVSLPKDAEQKKIGSAFCSLDALIADRESAVEKLQTLKKAMLEKMFPRADAKVPEVRFKGFDGEWKKKRLGDVLKIGNGKDYKHLEPGNVPVYGTGGYMASVAVALAHGPSVCIGRKGTIDNPQYLEGAFWTVDTLFYTYSYNEIDAYWLYCQFKRIPWRMYNEASGVPSLSKMIIEEVEILVPSLPVQRKIGAYFQSLDALISARQEEIGKLKDLKKALLDRMFV